MSVNLRSKEFRKVGEKETLSKDFNSLLTMLNKVVLILCPVAIIFA